MTLKSTQNQISAHPDAKKRWGYQSKAQKIRA